MNKTRKIIVSVFSLGVVIILVAIILKSAMQDRSLPEDEPYLGEIKVTEHKLLQEELEKINEYTRKVDGKLDLFVVCEDEIFGLSTEGTGLFSYFDNQNLLKIKTEYFGETGKLEEDIYLDGNDIIFVDSLKTLYNWPFYIEGSEVASTSLSKLYFRDNSLILWTRDGIEIDADSQTYKEKTTRWKEKPSELKKLITKKNCK